eukprot:1676882-Pyramimonas_sp.AAC.1
MCPWKGPPLWAGTHAAGSPPAGPPPPPSSSEPPRGGSPGDAASSVREVLGADRTPSTGPPSGA